MNIAEEEASVRAGLGCKLEGDTWERLEVEGPRCPCAGAVQGGQPTWVRVRR